MKLRALVGRPVWRREIKGLCENPDCAAFFDEPPVRRWDRYRKRIVRLCRPCAKSQEKVAEPRYQSIPPPERGK